MDNNSRDSQTPPGTLRDTFPRLQQAQSQPIAIIAGVLAGDPVPAAEKAREAALHWIQKRAGGQLPHDAWLGQPFEIGGPRHQPASAVRLHSGVDYWAAQLHDQDKVVAGRTWVTEISIATTFPEKTMFGVRLTCVSRQNDPPPTYSVPGVVRQIANQVGFVVDDLPAGEQAWRVQDHGGFERLLKVLTHPDRRLPIYVVSTLDDEHTTAIDGDALARATLGVAHVAVIPPSVAWELTYRYGKEYSVFGGAVRMYRPGFDPEEQLPFTHHLTLPQRIADWDGGANGYAAFLAQDAIRQSTRQRDTDSIVPTYDLVRRRYREEQAEAHRHIAQTEAAVIAALEQQNRELGAAIERDVATYESYVQTQEQELQATKDVIAELEDRHRQLLARISVLEDALKKSDVVTPETPLPATLDDLGDWAGRELAGRVTVHSRALRAAKKSNFQDPPLVYRALQMLGAEYRDMRLYGGHERKAAYEAKLHALGLKEEASFAGEGAHLEGDTYFITHLGRRRELDRHLKGSNTRDERYCLRIYFFWDGDRGEVVVGSLPGHLDTRAT